MLKYKEKANEPMLVYCTVQADGPAIVPPSQDSELIFKLEGKSHITYQTFFFFSFPEFIKTNMVSRNVSSQENVVFIWKKKQKNPEKY